MTADDAQRTPTPTPPPQGEGEQKLAFDPDASRDKCRAERDRRLRDDGKAQCQEIKGRFA
jgi:hypothetical protein